MVKMKERTTLGLRHEPLAPYGVRICIGSNTCQLRLNRYKIYALDDTPRPLTEVHSLLAKIWGKLLNVTRIRLGTCKQTEGDRVIRASVLRALHGLRL